MKLTLATLASLAGLAFVANTACAKVDITAIVATDTKPTITFNGTLKRAYNFGLGELLNIGGTVSTVTYDDITFTNIAHTGSHPNPAWSVYAGDTTGIQIAGNSSEYSTTSLGADDVWFKTVFTSKGAEFVMNITGLDNTKAYEIKVLYGEPRAVPQAYDTYTDDVTITAGVESASVGISFGDGVGDYCSSEAYVDGTTSATFSMGNANGGPGLSAVLISEVPVRPDLTGLEITSITSAGGNLWDLTLKGAASTGYEFYSDAALVFAPGTLLTPTDNGKGTVAGDVLTTDSNGEGEVQVTLSGTKNFVRAQTTTP